MNDRLEEVRKILSLMVLEVEDLDDFKDLTKLYYETAKQIDNLYTKTVEVRLECKPNTQNNRLLTDHKPDGLIKGYPMCCDPLKGEEI